MLDRSIEIADLFVVLLGKEANTIQNSFGIRRGFESCKELATRLGVITNLIKMGMPLCDGEDGWEIIGMIGNQRRGQIDSRTVSSHKDVIWCVSRLLKEGFVDSEVGLWVGVKGLNMGRSKPLLV